MWDILNNKTFLYEKINKKNKAELTFDSALFEYAHKNSPDDIAKGTFQLNNYRKDGEKERLENKEEKKYEKTYMVGESSEEGEEDLYFSNEF